MAEWLTHLIPDGMEGTSLPSGSQDGLSAASRNIGADAALWAVQVARRVSDAVDEESRLAADPFYAGEPERQVCESCILTVLIAINQDLPPGLMTMPPEASHIARLWARQGKPLDEPFRV
ncbi:hypothetical protein SBI67_28725 [Mycolicibacterium sp. 120266]|uniref:hypothetical protein n=1 Tax=Mycolicibacterium sp. 120266 TaxID=3090601 RepID=UPI00299D99E6|nr:hypothetical protein [Mycolicibacterium sp. 120266]MDX1876121.1 hypothetical protein [Mycolicibacterium sp. 120266]